MKRYEYSLSFLIKAVGDLWIFTFHVIELSFI